VRDKGSGLRESTKKDTERGSNCLTPVKCDFVVESSRRGHMCVHNDRPEYFGVSKARTQLYICFQTDERSKSHVMRLKMKIIRMAGYLTISFHSGQNNGVGLPPLGHYRPLRSKRYDTFSVTWQIDLSKMLPKIISF